MIDWNRFNSRGVLAAGAVALVALGAAGGAGAVQQTRPAAEMAPTIQTPIARLSATSGVVTVKGRVAEVFGDRFVVQDASGRAMINAGREENGSVSVGQPIIIQGRYDDGQLRASFLVDQNGAISVVGPRPGGPGRHGPGRDTLPPLGCAPAPGDPGERAAAPPSPPPANGAHLPGNGPAADNLRTPSAVPTRS